MQRAHELMMDNMSYFLDGAVDVDIEAGEVYWSMSGPSSFDANGAHRPGHSWTSIPRLPHLFSQFLYLRWKN